MILLGPPDNVREGPGGMGVFMTRRFTIRPRSWRVLVPAAATGRVRLGSMAACHWRDAVVGVQNCGNADVVKPLAIGCGRLGHSYLSDILPWQLASQICYRLKICYTHVP
jgi:hypothetical protein